jgi:hypothetical protein
MRRKLTMIALAAMMLAAGEPALAQAPNIQLQVQPKLRIQPKVNRAPAIRPPMIPPSTVTATIRIENQVRKIRVDGETGAVQN